MGPPKEDHESFELEDRGGHGSRSPPIDDAQSLSLLNNEDDNDDESEKGEELVKSLPYTPEEERAVVRKLDRRLVLFVAFLYMLSFLDRSSQPIPSTLIEQ